MFGQFLKLLTTKVIITCAALVPALILIAGPTEPLSTTYALLGSFAGYFLVSWALNIVVLGEYQREGKALSFFDAKGRDSYRMWSLLFTTFMFMFFSVILAAFIFGYEMLHNTPGLSSAETKFLGITVGLMMIGAICGDVVALVARLKHVPGEKLSFKVEERFNDALNFFRKESKDA
jgi:hypothetical protein